MIDTANMVWTEEMGEISGFGGDYEEACRNMVRGGVRHVQENNVDLETLLGQIKESPHIFGVVLFEGGEAKAFETAVVEASGDPSGVTGAMVHASCKHCLGILQNGWDEYVKIMSEQS